MYSKNDYRYYLEHQLMYSDDYLAHYGVKGMKWKKRKGRDILRKLSGADDFERNMYLTFGKEHAEGIAHRTKRAAEKTNSAMLKSIKKQNSPMHRLKEGLKPKKKKVEIISFKDQRTGKDYKKKR